MFKINENYRKLQGSYLFSDIAARVRTYQAAHPEKEIIRLGIGDVTLPLAPAVTEALKKASEEMEHGETFRGYGPEQGYEFLRNAIRDNDFLPLGADIAADEIFVSDGAKCDSGNIGDILSVENRVAICDPVYPVYLDTNVMAGRTGRYVPETEHYEGVVYMPCTEENGFIPEIPAERADVIYLCFPNNPTGEAIPKHELQKWVDYALENGSLILFDAAYEAYITEPGIPHSIYECEGAKACAIELRSFSKNAGFTGTRLGYTVVPKKLMCGDISLHALWSRRHGTKYNGAPYIIQRAGEAVYSPEGKAQTAAQVSFYLENAAIIRRGLADAGFTVYGGVNAPYIWLKTPDGMDSWAFFDHLLNRVQIVGTPGAGFGSCGDNFFRLTAFQTREKTREAVERMKKL